MGLYGLIGNPHLSQLAPARWEDAFQLITGGMVIFVAYEGFELIANAAPDIENPEQNIPKACYYSVIFVIVLYIVIAAVTVGSLPFDEIAKAKDYVLAEAAKPMLGQAGFMIITIAALLSTFSAINASLYGGSRVSYEIAEDDELPHELTSKFWGKPIGLMITTVATLLLANTLKLESISTAGSAGFLLIFAVVNFSGYKLSRQIAGNKLIPLLGSVLCSAAWVALIVQQYGSNQLGVMVAGAITLACFLAEYFYKKARG